MTREMAIAELKTRYLTMSQCLDKEELHKANEAINMAIEALHIEPYFWEKCPYYNPDIMFDGKEEYDWGKCTYKPEPCEDCISRENVLKVIETVCFSDSWKKFRADHGSNGERDYIINYIKQMPSVHPEQKIGKWIPRNSFLVRYKCSECERESEEYNYCPNCGAKMRRASE